MGMAALAALLEFLDNGYPWIALRWTFSVAQFIFLPGFVTLQALFPRRNMDNIEWAALSVGLSVALVPLLGLFLNDTPFGIRSAPTILVLTAYIMAMATIGIGRQVRGSKHDDTPPSTRERADGVGE